MPKPAEERLPQYRGTILTGGAKGVECTYCGCGHTAPLEPTPYEMDCGPDCPCPCCQLLQGREVRGQQLFVKQGAEHG